MKRQMCLVYLAGLTAFILYSLWTPGLGGATAMQYFNHVADQATAILLSSNANAGVMAVTRILFGAGLAATALMATVVVLGY
jgi:hypothetical protein